MSLEKKDKTEFLFSIFKSSKDSCPSNALGNLSVFFTLSFLSGFT